MSNDAMNIIRGITIAPPIIGRITMGHTELRGSGDSAKAIPKKDDHFSITTRCQKPDRSWEVHPIQSKLIKGKEKLLSIPVRVAFNDPRLTLQNSFSSFDTKTGRVLCSGNGETARRVTDGGVQEIVCPRPEACEYGQRARCKNMSRVFLQIEGQQERLGYFILRSTSWNTLTNIAAKLAQLQGLTGGRMAGIPMALVVKTMTSTQSFRTPYWYADLVERDGQDLFGAIAEGREYQKKLADDGLSQEGLETALLSGLANSDFAAEVEDPDEWISDGDLVDGMATAGGSNASARESFAGFGSLSRMLRDKNAVAAVPESGPAANQMPAESVAAA